MRVLQSVFIEKKAPAEHPSQARDLEASAVGLASLESRARAVSGSRSLNVSALTLALVQVVWALCHKF